MQHQIRDVTALVARLVVGVTFIAHGYQKLGINGMDKVVASFGEMGLPPVAAWFTALVEVIGGIALILGVLLPVAGVLLAAIMVGAIFTAHLGAGFFSSDGGFEYPLVLAGVSLALGFSGSRFTLPTLFKGKAEKVAV
ncbi:putative oxidoreductase [Saccharopolyspora kobensis]|uniref:Oxidoreductase n=1 Tax=Saccharopolyspora kobensis TaxID=146035 RepID=A0A1H6EP83_9PSEU|nr:DoxX family protein [Saccharopolyspora kobensis]SEG98554.1 putative oxidoreductase [Saccharopolyspora kobensis]SFF28594.1 putative oxidoreductase [Saccharopolyspora kobensis]